MNFEVDCASLGMHIDQSYSESLLQGLNSLRQIGALCDVEVISGTTTYFAHRVVLSAMSDYFKAMFTIDMGECSKKSVHMKDIDEKSLCLLLDFAYTGNININIFNVQSLLVTANMLQISKVVAACCEFLENELNASNCIGIMEFADAYSLLPLQSKCKSFIANNFTEISRYNEFLNLKPESLKNVLSRDDLNVFNEESVFSFLEEWILFDSAKRLHYFQQLFDEIRSMNLSFSYLLYLKHHSFLTNPKNYPMQLKINSQIGMKVNPYRILDEDLYISKRPRRASNSLIIIGGKASLTNSLCTCSIYNKEKNEWTDSVPLNFAQHYGAAVSLNGTIYLTGGMMKNTCSSSLVCLNSHSMKWSQLQSMIQQRCSHSVVSHGGLIYALGGYSVSCARSLRSMECYDPKTNSWTEVPEMVYSRCSFASVVIDDTIYALGGQGKGHLCSVEKYDVKLKKWEMAPAMNCKRINFGVAQVHGYIYVMGGHDGKDYLSSVERYDPITSEWTVMSSMPSARTGIGVAVINNKIFVLGGHDGTRYLDSAISYDPLHDVWSSVANMKTPRCYMAVTDVWLPPK